MVQREINLSNTMYMYLSQYIWNPSTHFIYILAEFKSPLPSHPFHVLPPSHLSAPMLSIHPMPLAHRHARVASHRWTIKRAETIFSYMPVIGYAIPHVRHFQQYLCHILLMARYKKCWVTGAANTYTLGMTSKVLKQDLGINMNYIYPAVDSL